MYPDKVKIGPFTFDISYEEGYVGEEGNLGCCNPAAHRITLSQSQDKRSTARILLHEAIEGWNSMYDVNLKHHQINQMEVFLYDFILSNPGILEFIENGED